MSPNESSLFFSYHINTDINHIKYGWKTYQGWEALQRAILKVTLAGCIWEKGVRLKKNFQFADLAFVDVDDGVSLDEAINIFEDTTHIIGTTKSHRKPKNGVIADRYRVVIPFEKRITCFRTYESSVLKLVKMLDGDMVARTAATPYFRCHEIASIKPFDKDLYLADIVQPRRKKIIKPLDKGTDPKIMLRSLEINFPGVYRFLVYGELINGGRNNSIFQTAQTLTSYYGVLHERARTAIRKIPINWDGITDEEFDHATRLISRD